MVSDAPDGAVIVVRVIPRAGRSAIAGTRDNALLVRIAAPPVEGAANAALIELLSARLDIPKRHIAILSGESGRSKRVKVSGVSATIVRERLGISS